MLNRKEQRMEAKRQKLESPNVELIDDVIIKIFDFLTVEERKPARLVCQSWKRMLSHLRFTSKTCFVLENCFISEKCPPWTIIRNLARPITNLRVGENLQYDKNEDLVDQKEMFYKEIGPHVIRISTHIEGLKDLPLHSFTGLKELIFDCNLSHVNISTIPERVEVLSVKECTDRTSFNTLRTTKKNLKVLKVSMVPLIPDNSGCFTLSPKLQQLSSTLYPVRPPWLQDDKPNAHALVQPTINFLNPSLILDLPDIVDLIQFVVKTLTELPKVLPKLVCTNLETLSLSPNDKGCFFVHSQVSLPKIRSLLMLDLYENGNTDETVCTECLQNLHKSCPSIKDLVLFYRNVPYMESILNTFKDKLTKLNSRIVNEANLSMMHQVKAIGFGKIPKDTARLYELCNKLPNVVKAVFYCFRWKFGVVELEVLGKCWPKLKYLKLEIDLDLYEASLCRILQDNFKCLVQFEVSYDFKNKRLIVETFDKIPTLRSLGCSQTYADYCKLKYCS